MIKYTIPKNPYIKYMEDFNKTVRSYRLNRLFTNEVLLASEKIEKISNTCSADYLICNSSITKYLLNEYKDKY